MTQIFHDKNAMAGNLAMVHILLYRYSNVPANICPQTATAVRLWQMVDRPTTDSSTLLLSLSDGINKCFTSLPSFSWPVFRLCSPLNTTTTTSSQRMTVSQNGLGVATAVTSSGGCWCYIIINNITKYFSTIPHHHNGNPHFLQSLDPISSVISTSVSITKTHVTTQLLSFSIGPGWIHNRDTFSSTNFYLVDSGDSWSVAS